MTCHESPLGDDPKKRDPSPIGLILSRVSAGCRKELESLWKLKVWFSPGMGR